MKLEAAFLRSRTTARAIMQLAGQGEVVSLTDDEREPSPAAVARGEFATDDEVRAVWAKHGR